MLLSLLFPELFFKKSSRTREKNTRHIGEEEGLELLASGPHFCFCSSVFLLLERLEKKRVGKNCGRLANIVFGWYLRTTRTKSSSCCLMLGAGGKPEWWLDFHLFPLARGGTSRSVRSSCIYSPHAHGKHVRSARNRVCMGAKHHCSTCVAHERKQRTW